MQKRLRLFSLKTARNEMRFSLRWKFQDFFFRCRVCLSRNYYSGQRDARAHAISLAKLRPGRPRVATLPHHRATEPARHGEWLAARHCHHPMQRLAGGGDSTRVGTPDTRARALAHRPTWLPLRCHVVAAAKQ